MKTTSSRSNPNHSPASRASRKAGKTAHPRHFVACAAQQHDGKSPGLQAGEQRTTQNRASAPAPNLKSHPERSAAGYPARGKCPSRRATKDPPKPRQHSTTNALRRRGFGREAADQIAARESHNVCFESSRPLPHAEISPANLEAAILTGITHPMPQSPGPNCCVEAKSLMERFQPKSRPHVPGGQRADVAGWPRRF